MPLSRCPRTGKLFNSDDGPVHPDGREAEEADYEKVREYLHHHANASPEEVAKKADVPYDCVERMIKQGMLQTLTAAQLDEQQKKLLDQRTLARLNQSFAEQIASIRLPEKKDVEFGGTVRSALDKKRRSD
jgi:hypothetical protein